MNYTTLEFRVMDKILQYSSSNITILRSQFENSKPSQRDISGAGFYTKIEVDRSICSPILTTSKRILFGDIICLVDGSDYLGFLLYIEDGYISLLEGYTFDGIFSDPNIEQFELIYEFPDKRKLPDILL